MRSCCILPTNLKIVSRYLWEITIKNYLILIKILETQSESSNSTDSCNVYFLLYNNITLLSFISYIILYAYSLLSKYTHDDRVKLSMFTIEFMIILTTFTFDPTFASQRLTIWG